MKPYRRRLVGLPLQRSLFREIGRAGEILGLTEALPGGRFAAWLDDQGDLFLDRSSPDVLADVLAARLTPDNLESLERDHRAACAAVTDTTEHAARCGTSQPS